MKNILITGVAGFIGSSLCKYLSSREFNIIGIDNLSTGSIKNIPKNIQFIKGDCSDPNLYKIKKINNINIDIIIHLAGQSSGEVSFENPIRDINDNCISTLELLKFASKKKIKKFLYASSMSVYGKTLKKKISENNNCHPLSIYGVGKQASENYLRIYSQFGIECIVLRLFNVYGYGQDMKNMKQGMISIYLSQALKGHIIVKGSKNRFRDFIYIDDVCIIVKKLLKKKSNKNFEIYNICTGIKSKVEQVIEIIKSNFQFNISVEYKNETLGDQFGIVGNNSYLKSKIGKIKFTTLNDGIKKFIKKQKQRQNS